MLARFVTLAWISALAVASAQTQYEKLFQNAAALSQQGKYDLAAAEYKKALAMRPGAPQALNNLAVMYYEGGHYSEAFATASLIWQTHPELKSAALIAGMSAVQCNRSRDAILPLESLLSVDADNRDAVLALASAHIALNELDKAAELYQRQTTRSPRDLNAWYGLAICYERTAEQSSRKLAEMPGGASLSRQLLGEYLQSMGDNRLAAEAFGAATAQSVQPTAEADAQYRLARDYAAKSKDAFEQFVSLAPESWQAQLFMGDVERQHGKLQAALAYYQKAAADQPHNPAPALGIGTVYWELGEFDQASTYLQTVLSLNPDAMQAVFELANIAIRQHREAEAIPLLKRYLMAQPNALAARADLGRAYLHLASFKEAAAALSLAAVSDETGELHYQLATALRKLGRGQEADSALEESAKIRAARLELKQKADQSK